MNTNTKSIILCLSLITVASVKAEQRGVRIVYGEDDRKEVFDASRIHQLLAKSTAGMIENLKAINLGSVVMLPPTTLSKSYGLCPSERFGDQPSAVSCSGFLVGPDLLVTAGHCIRTQKDCDQQSWVFDYQVDKEKNRTNVIIPKNNIYKCKSVIEAAQEGNDEEMRDFSLIQLDRVVEGREPLPVRQSGKIPDGESLVVIGHPSGLPLKIADNGKVFRNTSKFSFETNLDTFGGNSGSAVFNATTLEVEGILVRGATDYLSEKCGTVVNQVDEDITDATNLGESVSRILDISSLAQRSSFLSAAKLGNLDELKRILAKAPAVIKLYDNDKNTALHIAIKNRKNNIVDFLIQNSIELNTQNIKGETPLHIAAYVNNKGAAYKLMGSGANPLLLDGFNALPSGRTNYLAFKFRYSLKKYQKSKRNTEIRAQGI